MKKITFVVAPDIPNSEVSALQAHLDEAFQDPDYTLVTNYTIKTANLDPDQFLLIAANALPVSEVVALREKINEIRLGNRPPILAVNYDVDLNVVTREV